MKKAPIDLCWEVLMRLTQLGFVPRANLRKYATRLAKKYSKRPDETANRLLRAPGFTRDFIGIVNRKPVMDSVGRAHCEMHPDTLFCWFTTAAHECFICGNRARDTGRNTIDIPACWSPVCEELYEHYYAEGRSKPVAIRGMQNKERRFDYLLCHYIRRKAEEKIKEVA